MRARIRSCVLTMLLASGFGGYAQILEGTVYDQSTGKPLSYVNIAISGTHSGTISGHDGHFRLDVSNHSKDSLSFSIVGYRKKKHSVKAALEKKNFELLPEAINLESVIVSPLSPEEYIRRGIENIPQNYVNEPFNGTMYYRSEVRLNGNFIEASEAIIKGYIMPVTGKDADSTRLQMMAYKYFDEQEEAMNSITIKKKRKEKPAIKGLDSTLLDLTQQLSEFFGVYTQVDSNLIKQMYDHGYNKGKEKYWLESLVQQEGRNLIKIGFKGGIKMASQQGELLLDEKSLAFVGYNHQIKSSNLKIKALLWVLGIGFKKADVIIQFTSIPTEEGWLPDILDVTAFVDMEKNRWFAKDVPIRVEIKTHISFLEVEAPATDLCLQGKVIEKEKHLKDQFDSDPGNPLWGEYKERIRKKLK